ncbi:DUF192 domain-containing protein [Natronorubrum sp. JWXQ-INN-674]|uniref:DUF192 domain-containing protein n=1 Tax=Natronorubrum halalkaliphilum TaxID=2691917 RepID=A0A6B0VKV4_9EURY|nr:DUF192 domain-containing protein [Natronorubrum halalkaliphilum]MXV61737.1 DUF192 domain-containing protein [Natronorubrum halalkaliphilum]
MTSRRSPTADRRTVLTGLAVSASSVGFAGCTDAGDGDARGGDTSDSDDPGGETTPPDSNATVNSQADSSDDETSAAVHMGYESTDVRVTTSDGNELGAVTAAIADTPDLRSLGLSDTETLPEDRGMLFVYETVADRTFVMPEMSFGIDIVFADEEGAITSIHHAPKPEPDEDGAEQRYPGRGQYVLEVGYEWTAERGIEEGDILQFDL